MTRTRAAAVLIALAAFAATAAPRATATGEGPDPWFGTFSIIAVDPTTGELGVGVQSRAFGAVIAENQPLDLCAAEIDADAHAATAGLPGGT